MAAIRRFLIACTCLFLGVAMASAQQDVPIRQFGVESRPLKHARAVRGVAVIDDGKTIVSTDSNDLIFWDRASRREIRRHTNETENTWFGAMDVSRDRKVLVTTFGNAGVGATFQVRAADGTVVRSWESPAGSTELLALSRDGKRLASLGIVGAYPKQTYFIELWDVSTGKRVRTIDLKDHLRVPPVLAFSADGKTLAIGAAASKFIDQTSDPDLTVHLWNVETGKLIKKFVGHSAGRNHGLNEFSFSDDGKYLASAGSHETIIWDLATGKSLRSLDYCNCVRFAPNSSLLACGSNTPTVIDAATGRLVTSFPHSSDWISQCAFTPDAKTVITGDNHGMIRSWNVETGKEIEQKLGHHFGILEVAFSPDGSRILAGSGDPRICMWNVADGKRLRTIDVDGSPDYGVGVSGLRFTADGKSFVASNALGKVTLWSTASGLREREIPDQLRSLDVDPAGKWLVAATWEDELRIWNLAAADNVRTVKSQVSGKYSDLGPYAVALSLDGKQIASMHSESQINNDTSIHLWDVRTGAHMRRIGPFDSPKASRFDPPRFAVDGTLFYSDWRGVTQWNTKAGHEIRTFPADWRTRRKGGSFALSADGQFLAVNAKNQVHIHETLTGGIVHAIPRVSSALAFSPDGRTLLVGEKDGSLTLWNVHPAGSLRAPAGLTARDLDKLWLDLASYDAAAAYRALWRLIDNPAHAVPLLTERLTPAEKRNPEEIAAIIEKLAHADAQVRADSARRLTEFGAQAEEPLYEALRGKQPIETRKQIEQLLAHINEHPVAGVDLQRQRAILLLERIHTPATRKLLQRMANGPANVPITEHAVAELARWQARQEVQAVEVLSDERVAQMRQHLPGTRAPIQVAKNGNALALSGDGRWVACATDGDTVRVLDASNGKPHGTLLGVGKVSALAFSPDSKRLVCAGAEVRVWHFLDEKKIHVLKNLQEESLCVAYSPDGKWIAAGTKAGIVMIWSSAGAVQQRVKAEVDAVTAVVFAPDSQAVLVGGMEKKTLDFNGALKFQQSAPIRQWSVATGKLVRTLDLLGTHLAFSADRRTLVVSGCLRGFVSTPGTGNIQLALGGYGGFVTIEGTTFTDAIVVNHWDWQRGRLIRQTKSKGCVNAVSSDGRWMFSGGEDRHIDSIIEWNTNTTGGGGAHGNHDLRLHLWEALTGKEVLRTQSKYPSVVAISADGRTLAWLDGLANLLVWDLSPIKPAAATPPMEPRWQDLAGADAETAYQAQWILRSHPKESLSFLKTHLKPSPKDQDTRIAALASQLQSDNFKTRDAAMRELQKLGSAAEAAMEDTLQKELVLEARRRIQAMLDACKAEPIPPEELRQLRAVQLLQWIGGAEAQALLKMLAGGSEFSRQTREARTALEQLNRTR